MEVDEFVRRLLFDDEKADKRFALFLGAGCSVSSGIPTAADLVRDRWLPRLRAIRAPEESDHEGWAMRALGGYQPNDPGASYGKLIDQLFLTADERQREIESLCDGRSPGFGYAVLAQLVARSNGRFNVVLTTNFDDLVADALYLYTESRPLVIHHESLATFIRPTRTRPLVVKLHGDHRLAPRNTVLETDAIEAEIARHTAMVLNDRGLIFMGYGGNDRGIQKLLFDLPGDALPLGAYWVHPREPAGPIREWLVRRGGIWVRSGWFDEAMLLMRNIFDLPHPEPNRFTKIFVSYHDAFQRLSAAIEARPEADISAAGLKEAVRATEKSFPDFWKAVTEASNLEKADPVLAERVYRSAIEQFPAASPLLRSYALFLARAPLRRDEAELIFKRALKVDPRSAAVMLSYGGFLEDTPDRRGEAEVLFRRAIVAAPQASGAFVICAKFLAKDPVRREEAEALFRRAIELGPTNAYSLVRYATFLEEDSDRHGEAESLFRRAVEAQPPDTYSFVRFAVFLAAKFDRHDEAEALFKRAIAIDPTYAIALSCYASFLAEIPTRRHEAGLVFEQGLAAAPDYTYLLLDYAMWLERSGGDSSRISALRARAKALE